MVVPLQKLLLLLIKIPKKYVYSFSLIVYEIVTSEIPFSELTNIYQIYSKVVIGGYRPPFNFPVPASYRNMIEKCWSYDPRDRPTFQQIVNLLKTDNGFITQTVDKDEFMEYVENDELYKNEFYDDNQIVKLNQIDDQNENLEISTIDQISPEKVVEEDNEVIPTDQSDVIQRIIDKENSESQFEQGKFFFNKAIECLLSSMENGCTESTEFLMKHVKDLDELIRDKTATCQPQKVDEFPHPYIEELKKLLSLHPPVEGRRRSVLVSTGSFCPIHKGHLKLFDTAARFLSEEYKIDSLIGIISPTSDLFVSNKFRSASIPFEHRYEMTKLACLEHNKEIQNGEGLMIVPDEWEGTRIDFYDFQIVYEKFKHDIEQLFPDEDLLVLYVCGGDLFIKRQCYMRKGFVGISRPGFQIESKTSVENDIYVCNDKKYAGVYTDATFAINLA